MSKGVEEVATSQNLIVAVGLKVKVKFYGGLEQIYLIGSSKTKKMPQALPEDSPLGQAIMGRKRGDIITCGRNVARIIWVRAL